MPGNEQGKQHQHDGAKRGVLVTTGREITVSPKVLFINAFCWYPTKRSFYEADDGLLKRDFVIRLRTFYNRLTNQCVTLRLPRQIMGP